MASPHGVASLLRGRRGDVAYHKFKPENYHEINRVLGQRFAPAEINRVVSKHRADAASAYLRRLHRDVERSQKGFYQTLSVLPLQVKRLSVMKEDQRSFKSLLIPKRPPLANPQPSPRSDDSSYPRDVPPQVVQDGSNYVPHKFFSPHTHIHVLFKQMPQTGSVTPRKGGPNASVTSGGSSPVSLGGKAGA
ncbi:hypothetical protein BaRGS_00034007 [Batillaria attramentaria]|uniref:Uncharacterized protein n=1 Tax=Batillaria attramentaria TaxID=370345 RepID=A0ABD0JIE4_9CAEN|nr:hypothetical protein BaRGS_002335 [Batillaria attramentaria]